MRFIFNDGGRSSAGYKGSAGDCVARSIAIVSGLPYQQVYDALAKGNASKRVSPKQLKKLKDRYAMRGLPFDTPEYREYIRRNTRGKTAANGIVTTAKWFKDYMLSLGFEWVATMKIGTGCKVHLKAEELPEGRLVVFVSKHATAVVNGVIHDTHDPSRGGTRCVYGYWKLRENGG